MNKKGFSLIELLAVIAIIGIIAVITFPVIDDVITNSEKKTFKSSVEELNHIVTLDYAEFARSGAITYTLNKNDIACTTCTNKIKYQGEIEDGTGTVTVEKGKITSVNIQNQYYKATLNDKGKVEVTEKK